MFVIKHLNFAPSDIKDRDWSNRQENYIGKLWNPRRDGFNFITHCTYKEDAKRFFFAPSLVKKLKKLEEEEIQKDLGPDYLEVPLRDGVNRLFSIDGHTRRLRSKWSISL